MISTYGGDTYGGGYYGVATIDPVPDFVVEILGSSGAWIDATCDTRTINIQTGRSTALDSFAAGTCTLAFANFDDWYSAWNDDGIWSFSSDYRTDVPIRIRTALSGDAEPLFAGSTDSVTDTWPGTLDAVAIVQSTDGFKYLARHKGAPGRAAVGASELSGARIARLATDAAYMGPQRRDAGTVNLQAIVMDQVTLDDMNATRENEFGFLYIDRDGTLVYRQRDAIETDTRMTTVQWVLTDSHDIDGVCYTDLKLEANDDSVINTATVTRVGGTPQTRVDTASAAAPPAGFGPRTWTRDQMLFVNDTDAASLAQLIVTLEADNDRRVSGVTFSALDSDNAYAMACGVRLLDRVQVLRTFPGGHQLVVELLVEGIGHNIVAGGADRKASTWDVNLNTSTALNIYDFGKWDAYPGPVGAETHGWDLDTWGI